MEDRRKERESDRGPKEGKGKEGRGEDEFELRRRFVED